MDDEIRHVDWMESQLNCIVDENEILLDSIQCVEIPRNNDQTDIVVIAWALN